MYIRKRGGDEECRIYEEGTESVYFFDYRFCLGRLRNECACQSETGAHRTSGTLFWEIKGAKGSVFVLGTIHIADKTFYPLEENVLRTFDGADRLVSELGGLEDMQAIAKELLAVIPENMNIDPEKNLLKKLSQDELTFLNEKIGEFTVRQLASFNPWILNMVLSQLLIEQSGLNAVDGLDLHLIQRAGSKKIEALETPSQQLAVLAFGSFEDQLAILKSSIEALQNIDKTKEEISRLRSLYLANDRVKLAELLPELLSDVPSSFSPEKAQAFMDALLKNRNRLWAHKFAEYLQKGGTTFVFAGCAHFLGDSSVFEIMRQESLLE